MKPSYFYPETPCARCDHPLDDHEEAGGYCTLCGCAGWEDPDD